jgi:hypothetical protein
MAEHPAAEGGGSADVETVIVLSSDQASLYQFLRPRQEKGGRTLVILDRRNSSPGAASTPDSAGDNRRVSQPEAALALMSVLGFMVLHRDGNRWTV